jgi:hypothetical protein
VSLKLAQSSRLGENIQAAGPFPGETKERPPGDVPPIESSSVVVHGFNRSAEYSSTACSRATLTFCAPKTAKMYFGSCCCSLSLRTQKTSELMGCTTTGGNDDDADDEADGTAMSMMMRMT